MAMRGGFIFRLAGFTILVTMLGFGQAAPDPWLIITDGDHGSIHAHTKRADLVRQYGAANVVDRDIDIGEGETEPGTVLFPSDPKRTIEILWKTTEKLAPKSAQIAGANSQWKAAHDVSLGAALKELEQLNGRPFHLFGFDWDYSGTVSSWDGGTLEPDFQSHGRVIIRLDAPAGTVSDQEHAQVAGDADFSSHHPVMQKMNPRAYQIIWQFP